MAPFRKISKFFNQIFSPQTGVEVASSTLMEGIDDDPMEGIESTTVDDGKSWTSKNFEIKSNLEVVDCGEYVDQGEARDQLATTEIDNKLIGNFESRFQSIRLV